MFHCSNQILDPRFQCEDILPRGQRRLNLAGAVQTAGTGLESGGRGGRRSPAALCSPGLGSGSPGSPGSPGSSHCRGQQGCPGNWQSDRQNSADFSPPPGDDHSLLLLLLVLFDRCCSPRCQGYLDRCFLLLCLNCCWSGEYLGWRDLQRTSGWRPSGLPATAPPVRGPACSQDSFSQWSEFQFFTILSLLVLLLCCCPRSWC